MRRHRVSLGRWKGRPGKLQVSWRDLKGRRRVREFEDTEDGQFEAERFRVETLAQLRSGTHGPDDRMTFAQLADAWLDAQKGSVRRYTYKGYRSAVEQHLKPAFEKMPAMNVRPALVAPLVVSMRAAQKTNGTIQNVINALRAIYKFGRETLECVSHDPAGGIARAYHLSKRKKWRRPLTEEEVGRFMHVAPDVANDHLLHFHTLLELGGRHGEIMGIMEGDFDFENGVVSVCRQVYDDGTIGVPKSEEGIRKVRPSTEYLQLAAKVFAERKASGLISPWLLQPEFSLPQPTQKQALRAKRLLRAAFKRVAEAAHLPSTLSPHWLRHTYATDLLGHGEDLARVSAALGHSRKSTTLNMYVEAIPVAGSTAADEAAARRRRAAETADMTKVSKFSVRKVAQLSS